ncbi:MAG: agmatinase [Oligoflexia bacterium]|nr:agmatinase [Oligoflexia bacterium]
MINRFLEQEWDFTASKYVVVPVPLEVSVSYGKGTASGPHAVLGASFQLENYDEELDRETINAGVHVLEPIDTSRGIECVIEKLSSVVTRVISNNKIPVVLGGEHTLSLGVFKGLNQCCYDFSIVHFDAHLDLRNEYEGSAHSHACVMRRIREQDFRDIVSVGIRSVSKEEAVYAKETEHKMFYARDLFYDPDCINNVVSLLKRDIYITFDVDVLDPAVLPSTGTPEPGGLGWYQLLEILKKIITGRRLLAMDMVELAPDNINHHSEFTIAKLLYKIMGYNLQFGSG